MMENLILHEIKDKEYAYLITVLDYEISVVECLSKIRVPACGEKRHKVIVDMALRCGLNKDRFAEFDVGEDGDILCNTGKNVRPTKDIVEMSNSYLREKREIVSNSMLSDRAQKELLGV